MTIPLQILPSGLGMAVSAQDKIWDRAGVFLDVKEYKHLQAWTEKIANRPAVKRGLEVEYKEIDA